MNSLFIVLPILILLMFCLGLELSWIDFKVFKSQPKALIIGLIAQLVLLPLVAWLLIGLFDLEPILATGFLLIACCPGGSSSNMFTRLAQGDTALSVSLTAISSIITIVTIPFLLVLFTGREGISLPAGKLFVQNILMVLAPLAIGMLIKHRNAQLAARWSNVLVKWSGFLLLVLVTLFFIENRAIILEHGRELGIVTTALLVVTMLLGGGISRLFNLPSAQQRTIVIEVGMQNAAQAIAIASSPFIFNSSIMAVPAIIYAFEMNILLLGYLYFVKKRPLSYT